MLQNLILIVKAPILGSEVRRFWVLGFWVQGLGLRAQGFGYRLFTV